MQNDNFKITERDNFSETIREKLIDFEVQVDDACWEEISERLVAKKKKKVIPFWWWLSGGAAVATLALFFSLGFNARDTNLALKSRKAEKPIIHSLKKNTFASNVESPTKNTNATNTFATHSAQKEKCESKHATSVNKQVLSSTALIDSSAAPSANQPIVATNPEKTDSFSNSSRKNLPEKLVAKKEDNPIQETPIKKVKAWELIASIGQNGSADLPSAGNDNLYAADATMSNGEKNLTGAQNTYNNILSPSEYSDKTYHPGLAFGVLARKKIYPGISIETGLMYTYLLSTFRGSNWYNYDARMELHYVGIPLNVNINLWQKQRWSIYWSSGMMVEKGLRSIFTQHQYFQSQTTTTSAGSKIDGLQWSVRSGLGADYQLYKNTGIYLESDLGYFFDNNQPISTRTEQPVSLGIKAGIRFHFGK